MIDDMEIIIQDSSKKVVGKVKGDILFDVNCNPVCKVLPSITFALMVDILFMSSLKIRRFNQDG